MTKGFATVLALIILTLESGCAGGGVPGGGLGNGDGGSGGGISGNGPLRAGIYTGSNICDSLFGGSTAPAELRVIVTDEGYPSLDGQVLHENGKYVTSIGGQTFTLDVVRFEENGGTLFIDLDSGEVDRCTDTCFLFSLGTARNGVCEDNRLCNGDLICDDQNGNSITTGCDPGTDCTDCRGQLGAIILRLRQEHTYTPNAGSGLDVVIRWIFVGAAGQIEFTCEGKTVKLPENGG